MGKSRSASPARRMLEVSGEGRCPGLGSSGRGGMGLPSGWASLKVKLKAFAGELDVRRVGKRGVQTTPECLTSAPRRTKVPGVGVGKTGGGSALA